MLDLEFFHRRLGEWAIDAIDLERRIVWIESIDRVLHPERAVAIEHHLRRGAGRLLAGQAEARGELLERRQEIGSLFFDGLDPSASQRRGDSDRRYDSRRDPEQWRERRKLRNGGDQQTDDDFHVTLLADSKIVGRSRRWRRTNARVSRRP